VKKLGLLVGAVAALALPAAVAQAGSGTDRATGGGQVLIGTRGGAGDTIAFQARGTQQAATGEVQYVDRTDSGQTTAHGSVQCLAVNGNMAKLSGTWDSGGAFQVIVVDNGQGAAASDDTVTIQQVDDPSCEQEDNDDDDPTALARGNAQVYDASGGSSKKHSKSTKAVAKQMSYTTALKLARL
jgi:hypothetical protein